MDFTDLYIPIYAEKVSIYLCVRPSVCLPVHFVGLSVCLTESLNQVEYEHTEQYDFQFEVLDAGLTLKQDQDC